MTELPDWITVGAKVAIVDFSGWLERVHIRTVERFTNTLIVLEGDVRVRKDRAAGTLLPLTHPTVTRMRARNRVANVRHKLDTLLRDFDGGADEALALLDQAAELVATTRAGIANLTNGEA